MVGQRGLADAILEREKKAKNREERETRDDEWRGEMEKERMDKRK